MSGQPRQDHARVDELNPYAPPAADTDDVSAAEPHGFWREGTMLVVARGVVLPDRCVRCNSPAQGFRLSKAIYPRLEQLSLLTSLVARLVASLAGRSSTIEIGLCPRHRALRWFGLILLPVALLAPLAIIFDDALILPAFVVFVGGILLSPSLLQTIRIRRVDARHSWLQVGTPFLLSIPSRLPGRATP